MHKCTYTVREENVDDNSFYYASFVNGNGIRQEAEISYEVYLVLEDCRKHEKRQKNFNDRHLEHAELSEGQLQERMLHLPPALEASLESQEKAKILQAAIEALPEIRQRRFLLYYGEKLTQKQIATLDGCSQTAVAYSLQQAREKIKESLNYLME